MNETHSLSNYIGGRVRDLSVYAPEPLEILAERLGITVGQLIKLDSNENPYGPTRHTMQVLNEYSGYQYYPDPLSRRLREAISSYLEVDSERILVGNGSDELIDLTLRLFSPECGVRGIGEVLNCPPTFGTYRHCVHINDFTLVNIHRLPDFTLDIEAIESLFQKESRPRILFLANPNNPDGQLVPEDILLRLLALPLLVVLDEAYVEFSSHSYKDLANDYDNLIVLRTLSKWAGLAGLRVGYGVFPRDLMASLWRLKLPYNVNGLAQTAALATLEDLAEAQNTVGKIIKERDLFIQKLLTLPYIKVYPSQANFVLCQLSGLPIDYLRQVMEAQGIVLRYFKEPPLEHMVRITIGTPSQNEAVWAVLRTLRV